jgi:predicted O-linked N-acetylglucosamine transferase (SPINDLY family)
MVLDQNLKIQLQKLFKEKRYSEVISLILDETKEEERSAGLLNLLGVSRLIGNKKEPEILRLAIKDFKIAFLKEKNTSNGLIALGNLISTSCLLYDLKNEEINFEEIISFFKESESLCENLREIHFGMIKIYRRLSDVKNILFHLDQIIKSKNFTAKELCAYAYRQCFSTNWQQIDFLKYGEFLDDSLTKYPENKLYKLTNFKTGKIRLGFLSADITTGHSITYFLKTVLQNYNKEEFEIYLILNQKKEDQTTKYFKSLVDNSINIINDENIKAINIVRKLDLDILVDLMGFTSSNRIELLKNRVSYKQILWLGYCNTTGIKNMDYIISDPNLIFKNEKSLYSEKIIYLPNIWNCHSGFDIKREENKTPFISNNFITFGSFNNLDKVSDEVIEVWSKILKRIKNSKLIIKSSLKKNYERHSKLFMEHGVHDSVIFNERDEDFNNHINLYKQVDVALDTFPYNGVTTSFEAIWMGVPVLTMKGYNFNSRCGESINKNIKMECMIADDKQDYINKAVGLFENPDNLIRIREKIFHNVVSSPLFDCNNFSDDFFNSIKHVYNG